MRYQKRIKILPWLKINLSKSGSSLSIGKPGATHNIALNGKRKTTLSGLGSGLSQAIAHPRTNSQQTLPPTVSEPAKPAGFHPAIWALAFFIALGIYFFFHQ